MAISEKEYQAQYYLSNRVELLAERKKRYAKDAVYRKRIKERAMHRYRIAHGLSELVPEYGKKWEVDHGKKS